MTTSGPVLLVDDDIQFVESMARRLQRRELTVETAFSGEEALERLDSNKDIDVVIMDVSMPGMGGITALSKIRQQFPSVEVIMLSGHGMVEDAMQGIKLGAFDYLLKPCDMPELVSRVRQARINTEIKRKTSA